jgi:hypothetical protein
METDAKRVVREWNREIEAEIRREARQDDGLWKIVVWVTLEVVWFVALFAMLGMFNRAQGTQLGQSSAALSCSSNSAIEKSFGFVAISSDIEVPQFCHPVQAIDLGIGPVLPSSAAMAAASPSTVVT